VEEVGEDSSQESVGDRSTHTALRLKRGNSIGPWGQSSREVLQEPASSGTTVVNWAHGSQIRERL
jgi:hypothetical protein